MKVLNDNLTDYSAEFLGRFGPRHNQEAFCKLQNLKLIEAEYEHALHVERELVKLSNPVVFGWVAGVLFRTRENFYTNGGSRNDHRRDET